MVYFEDKIKKILKASSPLVQFEKHFKIKISEISLFF